MTGAQILQAIRAYVRDLNDLADAQVVAADSDAVKRAAPFLTVRVDSDDTRWLPVTLQATSGGTTTTTARNLVRASVAVEAFGRAAREWLEEARIAYGLPAGPAATLREAGVSVVGVGPIQNIAAVQGPGTEARWRLTMDVTVSRESSAQVVDTVSEAVVGIDLTRPDGDVAGTVSVTVEEP